MKDLNRACLLGLFILISILVFSCTKVPAEKEEAPATQVQLEVHYTGGAIDRSIIY